MPPAIPPLPCSEQNLAIPMRDGVILRANLWRPEGPGPFPVLLLRTPYGKATAGYAPLVAAGYVVCAQDTRGRYASDGDFRVFSEAETGDGQDGYDTIEWLAAQPWCNGQVATFGASYCSWMQWQAARLRPPHLLAMAAYSIPLELRDIDYTGAFRPARRVHWWLNTIAPDLWRRELGEPGVPAAAQEFMRELNDSGWRRPLPWSRLLAVLPSRLRPAVADWFRQPTRDVWHFGQAHHEITVPNLDIIGWYDHCSGHGRQHAGLRANGGSALARQGSRMIIGPWNHVGPGQQVVGGIDFGPAAKMDVMATLVAWFDHWLKGREWPQMAAPAVRYFRLGTGDWQSCETWPPLALAWDTWHLASRGDTGQPSGGGQLRPANALTPAAGDLDSASFTYDPADPLPTLWGKELFTVPADRRDHHGRRDLLYYLSEPLAAPLEFVGEPVLMLHLSASTPDTDFFAWLVDEAPDGRAIDVSSGMVRLRHRGGVQQSLPYTPGSHELCKIVLRPTACVLAAGHRLRLEISSSDFPNYDRNHNVGRDDFSDPELRVAVNTVWHRAAQPSRLLLPRL